MDTQQLQIVRLLPPQHTLVPIGSDSQPQYLRCYAPIEVCVETNFQLEMCIVDGPMYEYEPPTPSNISVTLKYDPPSAEGLQVRSKTYQIPLKKSGVFVELLRNHPERIEQWCAENSDSLDDSVS